ncbi:MAG: molybdate ABC transporter permease subunit [Alphaproteobacteria bacterium]|nr:molybdate ABC transporter permease subunit [Alphaproteobacteria bacterium]
MRHLPFVLCLGVLFLPLAGLVAGTSPGEIAEALGRPSTRAAIGLSLSTSLVALLIVILVGTPAAWALSRARGATGRAARLAFELPVVLPPAVLGIALLETFGRHGLFGPLLALGGVSLPFTATAVVLTQVLVGAPLYVLTAATAFRAVDDDLLLVARTLGAGPSRAWATIALPCAAPGLVAAAGLGWARALGEFGATLLFAGNLEGRTQTLPLAIYQAFEHDMGEARAIAVVLVVLAVAVLGALTAAGAGTWREA